MESVGRPGLRASISYESPPASRPASQAPSWWKVLNLFDSALLRQPTWPLHPTRSAKILMSSHTKAPYSRDREDRVPPISFWHFPYTPSPAGRQGGSPPFLSHQLTEKNLQRHIPPNGHAAEPD